MWLGRTNLGGKIEEGTGLGMDMCVITQRLGVTLFNEYAHHLDPALRCSILRCDALRYSCIISAYSY